MEPVTPPYPAPSVRRLTAPDLDEVHEIEALSYRSPWSRDSFLHELQDPRYSLSLVLAEPDPSCRRGERVIGYVCCWVIGDEMQVNNLAVHPGRRGKGLGELLLRTALVEGVRKRARVCYLDVRPSNVAARKLYSKLGFTDHGCRPRYYQDSGEDAIVMRLVLGADSPAPGRSHCC